VALPIFLYTSWVLYDRSMCFSFLSANEIELMLWYF
jgi:hypothetical protein